MPVAAARSRLDPLFRAMLLAVVAYVVIFCPADTPLSSRTCKALYLYRRDILSPAADRLKRAAHDCGSLVMRCLQCFHGIMAKAVLSDRCNADNNHGNVLLKICYILTYVTSALRCIFERA
ncbi:hypothetical protein OH77DRAFT_1431810 [Trametes cingulata]|nr:hypothetical protein OH77DRAFT_1431810 [Trametes cingulata]